MTIRSSEELTNSYPIEPLLSAVKSIPPDEQIVARKSESQDRTASEMSHSIRWATASGYQLYRHVQELTTSEQHVDEHRERENKSEGKRGGQGRYLDTFA